MITLDIARQKALSLPEATEDLHFEKASFRIKKKIFATFDHINNRMCLKLSLVNQDVFSSFDKAAIYPVPNKWGQQGWTFVELEKVNQSIFFDALTTAYCEVAPKTLSKLINPSLDSDL